MYTPGIIGKVVLALVFVSGLTSFWEFVMSICFPKPPHGSLECFVGQMDKSPTSTTYFVRVRIVCAPHASFSFPTFGSFDSRLKMFITLLIL